MAVKRRHTDRVWPDFIDYFRQDFRREVHGWVRVFQYFGIYIPICLVFLVGLVFYIDPFPPKKVYLATGQQGSSYYALAEKFSNYFRQHGVELVLVETPGLDQGLRDIQDVNNQVNAGFMMAGTVPSERAPDLVSLGSQKYSPVWVFYRGAAPDPQNPLADLLRRRMAVGLPDTTTRKLLERILSLHGMKFEVGANHLELSHREAVARFESGEIDAVFLVDGIEAETVQRLFKVKDRALVDFGLIDAYIKKIPFLEIVTLPRGAADIANVYPPQETRLLASTVTLVTERDIHPAIQWLFLRAAENISLNRDEFFSKPDYFPKYLDHKVPLSDVGERYFGGGMPTVFKYFPLWVATVIDGMGVILLAIFAILWPLFSKTLSLRNYPSDKWIYDYWLDLRDLDDDLHLIENAADAQTIIDALDEMLAEVNETWVDDSLIHRYYGLRRTIADIRAQASQHLEKFGAPVAL